MEYCRNEIIEQPIDDATNNLCTAKRSGIMCGQCTEGYSLKLGGYECASCSKSPLVGVVLLVAFMCAGAILVLLLLILNLNICTFRADFINFSSLDELGLWHQHMLFYTTYISNWMQFIFP